MPISQLHVLLRNRRFDNVLNHLALYPDEARILNTARQTPIAVLVKSICTGTTACALHDNAPGWSTAVEDAFDSLLRAYPRGAGVADKRHDTALNIACRHAAMIPARQTRPHETEEGPYYSRLLRWMILRMIDACPDAAGIPDANGLTPMQNVCNFGGAPRDIIKRLVRACPESLLSLHGPLVGMLDTHLFWDDIKPLLEGLPLSSVDLKIHLLLRQLWERMRWNFEQQLRENETGPYRAMMRSAILSEVNRALLASKFRSGDDDYYRKGRDLIDLLLMIGAHDAIDEDDLPEGTTFRPLNAAASLKVPAEFVAFMADLYPEQLQQADETTGWTPLHSACAAPVYKRAPVYPEDDGMAPPSRSPEDMQLEPTPVQILVRKYPPAASIADGQGNLPLHTALESGKKWATINRCICITSMDSRGFPIGSEIRLRSYPAEIEALVSAAPLTLRVKDDQNLYPFQIAAANADDRSESSLDTIFKLLRADPSVIAMH
mmetsp:Transcript_37981/g.83278  ORF Transcript_37981/g.83278 Transcript_37981/m.83278 type:complete len:492 (-) Transcript_37981:166-1641(-)